MCPGRALGRVVQPFLQQDPVGQPRQRVMQRPVFESIGRLLLLVACLCVDEVRRSDVGQGLGSLHVVRIQRSDRVSVDIQRPEHAVGAVSQREGEDGSQPGRLRLRTEVGEPGLQRQVLHCHGLTAVVGQKARSLTHLGLQRLEPQRVVIGGGDVVRRLTLGDQRDTGSRDGENGNDLLDQGVQDPLDGEVGQHRSSEVAQHRRQFGIFDHPRPLGHMRATRARSGRGSIKMTEQRAKFLRASR